VLTLHSNRPEASSYTARLSLLLEMLNTSRLRGLRLCLNFEKRFSLYDHEWSLRKTIIAPFSKFLPDLPPKTVFSVSYSGGMERSVELLQIREHIQFHERPRLPHADTDDFVRSHTYNDPWRENDLRLALYCSSQASEDAPALFPWISLPPPEQVLKTIALIKRFWQIIGIVLSPMIVIVWLCLLVRRKFRIGEWFC
jgi:hypothetical protein